MPSQPEAATTPDQPAEAPRTVAVVLSRDAEVGPACAEALASGPVEGQVVVLLGAGAERFGDGGPIVGVGLAGDGTDEVAAAIASISAAEGPVAVLVTVPGHGVARSVVRTSVDDPFEDHLGRELNSVHRAVRTVAPSMVAQGGGRIVLVSSTTAYAGAPWETAHGAAMAGIVGLARSAARELASSGVTVNVVAAGAIDTEHLRSVRDRDRRGAAAIESAVAATPVRRLGTPDDVAAAVAFLASAEASYMTGVVLPVDGGLAMGIG